jgi:hypothetical protein
MEMMPGIIGEITRKMGIGVGKTVKKPSGFVLGSPLKKEKQLEKIWWFSAAARSTRAPHRSLLLLEGAMSPGKDPWHHVMVVGGLKAAAWHVLLIHTRPYFAMATFKAAQ